MDERVKYPWQEAVLNAYMEFRPEFLRSKIVVAERAIAARLRGPEKPNLEEQIALNDALRALEVLAPSPAELG